MCSRKCQVQLSLSQILTILVLLFINTAKPSAQCTSHFLYRQSSNIVICLYDVEVTRLPNCSTQIAEKIIFPYGNSTDPWARQIQLYDGQSIEKSSISLERNGRPIVFFLAGATEDTIYLELEVRSNPLVFMLRYNIINGVANYRGECGFDNDNDVLDSQEIPSGKFNILQWGTNNSSIIIEVLSVSFLSTEQNATLMFGRGEHGIFTGQKISVTKVNLSNEITFRVLETGTRSCSEDWDCDDNPQQSDEPEGSLITEFLPIISVGAVIGVIIILFCMACARSCQNHANYDVAA